MKKSIGSHVFDSCNAVLLLLVALVMLYPLYYVFIVSISGANAVMAGAVKFWPVAPNLDTYRVILSSDYMGVAYMNTITYVIVGTAVNLLFTVLCAYPLSRSDFYGRKFFMLMIVFTMVFSGGIIPSYMVVQQLGMMNSIWAIVLPVAINSWNLIIMRTFFVNIPVELYDAAYMDGAGELRALARITLPLSIPVLATMGMFYAVAHWNSFFPALIYLNEKAKYPLQILLRSIVISGEITEQTGQMESVELYVTAQNIKYAVIVIVIAPIVCVYPFVQKYFVKGTMIGSLKG